MDAADVCSGCAKRRIRRGAFALPTIPKPVFGLPSSAAIAGKPVVGETVLYAKTKGVFLPAPRPFREYAASTSVDDESIRAPRNISAGKGRVGIHFDTQHSSTRRRPA